MAKEYTHNLRDSRVTAEFVRRTLDYDADTGVFRWKLRTPDENYGAHACSMLNARDAGKVAGCKNHQNYLLISLLGHKYSAHRLAWMYTHGEWPDGEVDHINGDPSDNRIVNLRVVTRAENRRNAALRKDSPSGYPGVWYDEKRGFWGARMRYDGKLMQLGRFPAYEIAVEAKKQAEEIYGFHENHGQRARMTTREAQYG